MAPSPHPEGRRQPGEGDPLDKHKVTADDSAGYNFLRGGDSLDTHRITTDDSAGYNFLRGDDSLNKHKVTADDSTGYTTPRRGDMQPPGHTHSHCT
jgi:hypothetical protein